MRRPTSRRRFAIATALLLQISLGLPALAQQGKPAPGSATTHKVYVKAEQELSPEMYTVYRIIDRLARANGQDTLPWRVVAVKEYKINAFASDRNLIAVYTGLFDQIYGDTAGLACVVAHEMAHHVARHISKQTAYEAMTTGIADKELQAKIQERITQVKVGNLMGKVLEKSIPPIWKKKLPFPIPFPFPSGPSAEELKKKQEQELQAKLAEFSRMQEFEADAIGYRFMATAGYDPQGCIRVMNVLARGNSSEFETSHPVVQKRIEQIQQLMNQSPPASLAASGRPILASTPPLTYSRSLDGVSLRVNSRFGSGAEDRPGSGWSH